MICLSRANVRAFHEILTVYTLNSNVFKNRMLFQSAEIFEASSANSVDPDQTAQSCSASTLFASILNLCKPIAWLLFFTCFPDVEASTDVKVDFSVPYNMYMYTKHDHSKRTFY